MKIIIILLTNDVIWSKIHHFLLFLFIRGFVIIIIHFFPFNVALALTTHLYCLFIYESILLRRSLEPSTKFGWWSSTLLSSFDLDCPSLVKNNVFIKILSLFWVPILSKTKARAVVTLRWPQTKALRGAGWLCCLLCTSSTLMYSEASLLILKLRSIEGLYSGAVFKVLPEVFFSLQAFLSS